MFISLGSRSWEQAMHAQAQVIRAGTEELCISPVHRKHLEKEGLTKTLSDHVVEVMQL